MTKHFVIGDLEWSDTRGASRLAHIKPANKIRRHSVVASFAVAAIVALFVSSPVSAGVRKIHKNAGALTSVNVVSPGVIPPAIEYVDIYADQSTPAANPEFAKYGLQVNLQNISGSPLAIAALISGQSQFALTAESSLYNALAQNEPVEGVMNDFEENPFVVVAKKSITSVSQLAGSTVGIGSVGSSDQLYLQAYIHAKGLSISPTWIPTNGQTNQEAYLLNGNIDAATLDFFVAEYVVHKDPNLHILITANQMESTVHVPGPVVVVADSYAASHPTIVEDFVEASIALNRKLYTKKGLMESEVNTLLPGIYTPADLKSFTKTLLPYIGVNGGMNYPTLSQDLITYERYLAPNSSTNHNIPKVQNVDVDTYVAKALKKLGVVSYDPNDTASWYKK